MLKTLSTFLLLSLSLLSCKGALGDPCDVDHPCENGLFCSAGVCLAQDDLSPSLFDLAVSDSIDSKLFEQPVDLFLDSNGYPHIYAQSTQDAYRALGFVMAQHYGPELEFLRRKATGTLSSLNGPQSTESIHGDAMAQLLGFERIAQSLSNDMPEADSSVLNSFSEGVSLFFSNYQHGIVSFDGPGSELLDGASETWRPVDSLAIGLMYSFAESFTADEELELHLLIERSQSTFVISAKEASLAYRSGFEEDVLRFEPSLETPISHPSAGLTDSSPTAPPVLRPSIDASEFVRPWLESLRFMARYFSTDRNGALSFAASGSRTQHGGSLLGSSIRIPFQPELLENLSSVFPVHLHIADENAHIWGLCRIGLPEFSAGFSESVSWSRSPSRADVMDLYLEYLRRNSDGSTVVRFQGGTVPLETMTLSTETSDGQWSMETALVPHHGPLIPHKTGDELTKGWDAFIGLSLRWSVPSDELTNFAPNISVMNAVDVEHAQSALEETPSQAYSWMIADRYGNIASSVPNCVPRRPDSALNPNPLRTGGASPALVMPSMGDSEWLDCDQSRFQGSSSQWSKGSSTGILISSGADQVGTTFDNDPFSGKLPYLSWSFEPGFRTSRLNELLNPPLSPSRMDSEDARWALLDTKSTLYEPILLAVEEAMDKAQRERAQPGTELDIEMLIEEFGERFERLERAWLYLSLWDRTFPWDETGENSIPAAIAGVFLPTFYQNVFGDELSRIDVELPEETAQRALFHILDPFSIVRTINERSGVSIIFDDLNTPGLESRDHRILVSLDQSLTVLETLFGTSDMETWSWSELHSFPGGLGTVFGCSPMLTTGETECHGNPPGALFVAELTPRGSTGFLTQRENAGILQPEFIQLAFTEQEVLAIASKRIRFIPSQ